jgi:hypothetical protein
MSVSRIIIVDSLTGGSAFWSQCKIPAGLFNQGFFTLPGGTHVRFYGHLYASARSECMYVCMYAFEISIRIRLPAHEYLTSTMRAALSFRYIIDHMTATTGTLHLLWKCMSV